VRKGVCALLADAGGIDVIGEATDGEEAIVEARRLAPQVILMDLRLPGIDGVAATREILSEQPDVGIVVLTGTDLEEEVLAAIEAGALGYLAKTSPRDDFAEAVQRVAAGEAWFPPHLTRRLLAHVKLRPASAPEALTEREREVLGLMARGRSNRQIAEELRIAEITVRTHVSHVLAKLGVSNRVEATLHALRSGIATLQDR
jgi:DNA-binding NarL/FixJ family response regulator